MTDEAALLAALADDPEDEVARLALADWLEERGDSRAAWARDPALWKWSAPDLHDPVPVLIDASYDPKQADEAFAVLDKLGPAAVAGLVACLEGQDADLARAALEAVESLGPVAAPAVPAVLDLWEECSGEGDESFF